MSIAERTAVGTQGRDAYRGPARAGVRSRLDALVGVEHVWRYVAITVPITLAGQALLYHLHAGLGVAGTIANILSFSLFVGPQYVLSRYWLWAARERTDQVWREAVLFWLIGALGLLLSTGTVWVADRLFSHTLWLNVASLGAFGAVWVARFFVLDRVLFVGADTVRPTAWLGLDG
jgi:putative flippase GtrA